MAIRIRLARREGAEFRSAEISPAEAAEALRAARRPAWLDLAAANREEAAPVAASLGLDEMSVDDCFSANHPPKCDLHDGRIFVVFQAPESKRRPFRTAPFGVFLDAQTVVTVRRIGIPAFDLAWERIGKEHLRRTEPATEFLAHLVLDAAIDAFDETIEDLRSHLDRFEEEIVRRPRADFLQDLVRLQRETRRLHRVIRPGREVIHALAWDLPPPFTKRSVPYLRDLEDHLQRQDLLLLDYREGLSGIRDAHLAVISNRMNEVMKTLTVLSTVILPPTLVAGIYGMNFDGMPELHWPWGYAFALALMVATGGGLLLWFRRRGWF